MKTKNIIFAAIALAFSHQAAAAYDETTMRCKSYNWKDGDIIPVHAQVFKTSSIRLPEEAFDVVWGAKELWDTDYVKNILFIKPLTTKASGKSTTITAVGKSGNTYEFVVSRVTSLKSHCTTVAADGGLVDKKKWSQLDRQESAQLAQLQAENQRLVQANAQIRQEAQKEATRKSNEAIRVYQSAINSKYTWSKSSGWYAASGNVVEDVHDDGRFTYVRLRDDSRGLMAALAEINGKKEILESKYIPSTRTYKVSGIFPKFILRAGESDLTITREGS